MSHASTWTSSGPARRAPVPARATRLHVCHFCHEPISSVADAFFLLLDRKTQKRPSAADMLFVPLAHSTCGPAICFAIPFTSLIERGLEGPRGWIATLRLAPWWSNAVEPHLRDAFALADRLEQKRALILGCPPRIAAVSA